MSCCNFDKIDKNEIPDIICCCVNVGGKVCCRCFFHVFSFVYGFILKWGGF